METGGSLYLSKLEVMQQSDSNIAISFRLLGWGGIVAGVTVNQQILAAIKFGVSQNKVIYVNLAAIKFGVSPRPVYVVYDRRIRWRRQY